VQNHNPAVQHNCHCLNSSYTPHPLYSSIRSNNHNASQTIPKSCQFQPRTTTQQPQNHCCQPSSTTTAPLPVTRNHTQHKPHHISHPKPPHNSLITQQNQSTKKNQFVMDYLNPNPYRNSPKSVLLTFKSFL